MSSVSPHPGLPPGWIHERTWQRAGRTFRPIEVDDLEHLRSWRNAQQSVLRQQQPLTAEHQAAWYRDVVAPSYSAERPAALLVTMSQDGTPQGYGGLTNIEWVSRRAELSFLAADERAAEEPVYATDLAVFLAWVFDVAFGELDFNRLFTETWAFRVAHIAALEGSGMRREGVMRQHVAKDGVVHDAVLHGIHGEDWLQTHG